MAFDEAYFNLGYLDTLSYKDTPIHRIDPRIKLIVTLAFIFTVVSFTKYEVSGLVPFLVFPMLILVLGEIPLAFILKKVLVVSPFAVFIGIFNPLLDSSPAFYLFGVPISGGWLSFLSVMIKFTLTISSGLLLIATTSFPGVCYALQRFGMPDVFVSQLMFLYRYIFVFLDETMKIVRARDIRSFGNRGHGINTFINLIGILFIRTIGRSERIYQAMLSRGFNGRVIPSRPYAVKTIDILFALLACAVFLILRRYNIAMIIGTFIT
jgi:cobalt/nickel transport system permease protein